jgi:hypothetical protein
LALELRVCRAYQVRHSQFLGWSHDDRSKALWEYSRQASACPSCGTRVEEWDPSQGGHPLAYRAEVQRCPGCEQVQMMQATLSSGDPTETRGRHVHLRRNEEVRRGDAAT